MKRIALLTTAVLALLLTACGSSSSKTSPSPSATKTSGGSGTTSPGASGGAGTSGGAIQVSMKNLKFTPSTVKAKVGQTIKWTNDDTPPHNVTYVSGPKFTSSSTLNPGATFQLKATKAGTIQYFCSIHPFMKGTIVVTG